MCILKNLQYANFFDVSRLFCSKVIEEKPLGDQLDPPPRLVKEGYSMYPNHLLDTQTDM